MQRRFVIAMAAGATLITSMPVLSQIAPRIHRIGFLSTAYANAFTSRVEAMKGGFRDLGYLEGRNIAFEYRFADLNSERLPDLAAELVRSNVDVIITVGTPSTIAAKRATATIPIVTTTVGDAVASGVVTSLARPEANVTGVTFLLPQLSAKRIEFIKEVKPQITKVAAFFNADNKVANDPVYREMESTARALKVDLQRVESRAPGEFESAFSSMARSGMEAVVVSDDTLMATNGKLIADLSLRYQMLSIGVTELADAGGAMAWGINRPELFRRTAYFADRLLKGAKPGDLPVELPTRFELIVNLKTAKALGLTIPKTLLLRADRVIE